MLRPRAETSGRGIEQDVLLLWTAMAELRVHVPLVAPVGLAAGIGAGLPILRPGAHVPGNQRGRRADAAPAGAYVLTADLGVGFSFRDRIGLRAKIDLVRSSSERGAPTEGTATLATGRGRAPQPFFPISASSTARSPWSAVRCM